MNYFTFSALGTEWSLTVDDGQIDDVLQKQILAATEEFDQRFSRFILTSEANAFRDAEAGTYPISKEFSFLLHEAQQLKTETAGAFDPAIGGFLELAGYDPSYRFQPEQNLASFKLPQWKVEDQQLTISGPVVFDIGGIGKGFWIDQIAQMLQNNGFSHYLVDGGGDMVGTTKKNGEAWRIGLEWPGDPERAIGVVELKNQGLAVSDTYKRSWGEWHHIVDTANLKPSQKVIWCAALAENASQADQFTSLLSLGDFAQHHSLAKKRNAEYLSLNSLGQLSVSDHWPGELFE